MPRQPCTATDEYGPCHREIYVRARDYPRSGVLCEGHQYLRPPKTEHTQLNVIVPIPLKAQIVKIATLRKMSVNQTVLELLNHSLQYAPIVPNEVLYQEEPP